MQLLEEFDPALFIDESDLLNEMAWNLDNELVWEIFEVLGLI